MKAKSVKKKWKNDCVATDVDRRGIENGAKIMGIELNDLITDTVMGMREVSDEIGLSGENL